MTSGESELPPLPARDPRGHKGTFGTVAIVGGSAAGHGRMIGAPAFAALGALRAGAGRCKVAAPETVIGAVLSIVPSATGIAIPVDHESGDVRAGFAAEAIDEALNGVDAAVVGPGLGNGAESPAMALRVAQRTDLISVVDADALNALARFPELVRDLGACIFTPHPGEFRRLAQPLRVTYDPADPSQRSLAAESLAQRLGVVVVLKGASTVVSDGQRTWVCRRGHHCLATGGTGDVLAGVIAGLAAQFAGIGTTSAFDIARWGVEAHAIAGEAWAARGASAGMLASELCDEMPRALESMR